MQTLQQQRAAHALQCVKAYADTHTDKKEHSEYKSYAAALPAMIHMNGLGQAAAFFKSKGGTHQALYTLLSDWLCAKDKPFSTYDDLLVGITHADMQTYRLAQAEAQALMDWVKKFAKAYLRKDKEN